MLTLRFDVLTSFALFGSPKHLIKKVFIQKKKCLVAYFSVAYCSRSFISVICLLFTNRLAGRQRPFRRKICSYYAKTSASAYAGIDPSTEASQVELIYF